MFTLICVFSKYIYVRQLLKLEYIQTEIQGK